VLPWTVNDLVNGVMLVVATTADAAVAHPATNNTKIH
jgi:hypothetical protein